MATALGAVEAFYGRYVNFASPHQPIALTLWTAHTHAMGAASTTPYISVTSPEKRCGKTRLIEAAALLVERPWRVVGPSEAALFRKIERDNPTLFVDEAELLFDGRGALAAPIVAVLNAGHRRGQRVPRAVGRSGLEEYDVFCPKLIAAIGRLPQTIEDRAIEIRLRRRGPDDAPVANFWPSEAEADAAPLRIQLGEVMGELADVLSETVVRLDDVNDRAAEAWSPLLAIADAADDGWGERARAAARALHRTDGGPQDQSARVRLLAAIKDVFREVGADRIASQELVSRLDEFDDVPWAQGFRQVGPHQLARLLGHFEISPTKIRVGSRTMQGYYAADFSDAWRRYLPSDGIGPERNNGTTPLTSGDGGSGPGTAEEGHRP